MKLLSILCGSMLCIQACGQNTQKTEYRLIGQCEGCEAIFESPVRFDQLNTVDSLPGFSAGPKLRLKGKVQTPAGAPAAGVVVYIYHTNTDGIYPTKGNESNWAQRHGYLRGWVKSGLDGEFEFYTTRPGSYPNSQAPAHIHVIVAEPSGKYYWVDDFWFDDDPLLTQQIRRSASNRGGSGIVSVNLEDGIMTVQRTFILGLNLPDSH